MSIATIFLTLFFLLVITGFSVFTLTSYREKHRRASRISALLVLLNSVFLITAWLVPLPTQRFLAVTIGLGLLILVTWLDWPSKQDIQQSPTPRGQVDERRTIFARARLQPGSADYEAYYQEHPEDQALDDAYRANPGLLDPSSRFYDPLLAASPEGGFTLTESLREAVNGPVTGQPVHRSPKAFARWVKAVAAYHGAKSTGVCQLQPYHVYSHVRRGTGIYSEPIRLNHEFAIVFTVEMSHEMINAAPRMPAVMESARQYARSGTIAVILAAAIRSLGYPARAHIDGNYRVIAPLVAKDAGLGEIGRMGLLMTPRLGPRVRLAVVTTNLPLQVDQPTWDPTVIDFCNRCSKCAAVCPAQAIPTGDRDLYPDGTLRWKLNPEKCYTYWTRIGTDCGRCMAVCPYSHADSAFHNLIRWGVRHSRNFRRAAIALDDLFYGKKPLPHPPPNWIQSLKI